jgi:hypothetical protein
MFPRMGTVYLARQLYEAQHAKVPRHGARPKTRSGIESYPQELAMMLRLGAVVIAGMGLVAFVMSVSH